MIIKNPDSAHTTEKFGVKFRLRKNEFNYEVEYGKFASIFEK